MDRFLMGTPGTRIKPSAAAVSAAGLLPGPFILIRTTPITPGPSNLPPSLNCAGPFNSDGTPNPNGVPVFTFGTLGRNSRRGPGINNYDLSLMKKTNITESKSLEFRAEFFNAFNHAQFLNPDNAGGSGTFGQITTNR